jgi:uncharacterized membrane protein YfcA
VSLLLLFLAALGASLLKFYTGFGLGTLLLPVYALFVSLPEAVALTAAVHLAGNLAKAFALYRSADREILRRFGLTALIGAALGALSLSHIDAAWLPQVLGVLIIGLGLFELWPGFQSFGVPPRWMPLGGFISGYLGGLSGHQGAPRSAFLLRAGIEPTAFLATGALIACGVDLVRLGFYGTGLRGWDWQAHRELLIAGGAGALLGVVLGLRWIKSVTLPGLRLAVGWAMVALGAAMCAGFVGSA